MYPNENTANKCVGVGRRLAKVKRVLGKTWKYLSGGVPPSTNIHTGEWGRKLEYFDRRLKEEKGNGEVVDYYFRINICTIAFLCSTCVHSADFSIRQQNYNEVFFGRTSL